MKRLTRRLIAFFSLIRVQNLLALLLAQIWVAKRVFQPHLTWKQFFWNEKFLLFLLSTLAVITAGYIIDGFYNLRRDLINRPAKTLREQQLAMSHKLYLYFLLNFLAVGMAWWISWRAALFFAVYIFLIWMYFHKWQFKAWFHEFFPPFLIMYPFFGIMLFYKQWNTFVMLSGILVYITLAGKEIIKEFLTLKGDMSQNFHTLLISRGETFIYRLIVVLMVAWMAVWVALYRTFDHMGWHMFLWFLLMWMWGIWILFFRRKYIRAYSAIKIFIVAGIFSLLFI